MSAENLIITVVIPALGYIVYQLTEIQVRLGKGDVKIEDHGKRIAALEEKVNA